MMQQMDPGRKLSAMQLQSMVTPSDASRWAVLRRQAARGTCRRALEVDPIQHHWQACKAQLATQLMIVIIQSMAGQNAAAGGTSGLASAGSKRKQQQALQESSKAQWKAARLLLRWWQQQLIKGGAVQGCIMVVGLGAVGGAFGRDAEQLRRVHLHWLCSPVGQLEFDW
uniref:Uncharacterized protein n=1 Tax=Tetradesmus obliquus TaxID=3088 RepID=A0A383W741_TETOB